MKKLDLELLAKAVVADNDFMTAAWSNGGEGTATEADCENALVEVFEKYFKLHPSQEVKWELRDA